MCLKLRNMNCLFIAIVVAVLKTGAPMNDVQPEYTFPNESSCFLNEDLGSSDKLYVYCKTVKAYGVSKSGVTSSQNVAIYEDFGNGNLYVDEGKYFIHKNKYATWGGKDVSNYSHMYYDTIKDWLWFLNL